MDNASPESLEPNPDFPDNPQRLSRKGSLARIAGFLVFVLPIVILANLAIWAAFNQPHDAEAWTGEIVGFSYSPYQINQDPTKNINPTSDQIASDLRLLSGSVQAIRTYSVIRGQENIPDLAAQDGLSVAVGAWINADKARNAEEVANLIKVAPKRNVVRVLVGNESLLRNDLPVGDLINYIREVKKSVWKPVSTAEPPHIWLKYPELVKEVDYIGVQILPYWEGIPINQAVDAVFERVDELHKAYPDKPIVITEVGWPSRGKIIPRKPYPGIPEAELSGEAVPSLVNQATFMREFLNRAKDADLTYYVMEAFDQPWKASEEGAAGSYWGIYNAERQPKFPMKGSISEAPQWRMWASIAAGLALVLAVVFMLIRQHVKTVGVVIFTIVTQVAASALAWAGLSVTGLYLSSVDTVVWSFLFLAQGLLLVVLLAEAIEFVEVIWTRHGERHFKPFEPAEGYPSHKVSIHVPIHNEPPEMVRDTLIALSKLDYPNFEVLVLDNNTTDPRVWQPVREVCSQLGDRFRFFHLENWPGFKAGALNYGLKMTAKDADIVAVIDSDYQVSPDWLRMMVPYFAKHDVAFVQSPQDYRDGHESLFKNMCYWEYAGFFHIGMVQRNYFNAVIQHGTMTLVRKSALEKVGAWAEWCICEDAELGIKLYRAGYDSVYVNHSFGKGLTPDTLAGYIGQRFRWAYGAVQIVKHHWDALAPWSRKGGLTAAQRYYFLAGWLPWFADGLALLFTTASIGLSAFALYEPKMVQLPVAAFLIPTIGSFAFKFIRSLWLYAVRVKNCSFIESLGAGVAALALTHTVAKAMLNGMVTSGKPFFRTPKCEDKPPLAAALIQVREEAVMLTALWGLALAFLLNQDFSDSLSRLWVAVLLVQSVPYAAAVLLSFINVLPAIFKRGTPAATGALSPAE
ncbi:MAG: glycosyltransferase [Parvibaculum sp.]|uniref:glycosyltransferase n=1 Tax=Parvibaculum sp. TaxID=2024848 RepID=UPI0028413C5E|nr:glycosyltransferase [Parvibaculum sp.]MDR3498256.1 glycosyltransferase [Parvibaculum sp.]